MNIWIVSMECAQIVEAGGIKDVTFSLCKELTALGNKVTLFLPRFSSNSFSALKSIKPCAFKSTVFLCGKNHEVSYTTARFKSFNCKVVLIEHLAFSEKEGVYVYTEREERLDPNHKAGTGHADYHFLDCTLCAAVAKYSLFAPSPDIVHCQDASTALTPSYIALIKESDPTLFKKTRSFVTIHNAGPSYHHEFYSLGDAQHNTQLPKEWLIAAMRGEVVEPFLLSSAFATLTTVSKEYAKELTNPDNDALTAGLSSEFFHRKVKIIGITNGIDFSLYNPTDISASLLPYPFDTENGDFGGKALNKDFFLNLCSKALCNDYTQNLTKYGTIKNFGAEPVVISYHGRIATQKGIGVLLDAMESIFKTTQDTVLVIVGHGEISIENQIKRFVNQYFGRAVFFSGYNNRMARLCVAGSDIMALPSLFEPCCLLDLICQTYGTQVVAHATGGLKKIIDGETGILYPDGSAEQLTNGLKKALKIALGDKDALHNFLTKAFGYIKAHYSWDAVVREQYMKLFGGA